MTTISKEELTQYLELREKVDKVVRYIGSLLELKYDYIHYDWNPWIPEEKKDENNPILVEVAYMDEATCNCCSDNTVEYLNLTANDLISPAGFITKKRIQEND